MTAPHGYEDWQRTISQTDRMVKTQGLGPTGVQQTVDYGFVGDRPWLYHFYNMTANHWDLAVRYWQDAAHTVSFGFQPLSGRQGDAFTQTLPVLGPFADLIATPSAANSTLSLFVSTAPSNMFVDLINELDLFLIDVTASAIGAGGNANFDASFIYTGPIYWAVFASAGAFQAELRTVDTTGAVNTLDFITVSGTQRPFYLPARHFRVTIFNQSGANQTYSVKVIGKLIDP